VKKGCYPGQEIVARTHFLGKAKRGIALFESDSTLEAGVEVNYGDRAIGSIVSAASQPRPLAMAVLPLERPSSALQSNGVVLHEVQMLDGLQR